MMLPTFTSGRAPFGSPHGVSSRLPIRSFALLLLLALLGTGSGFAQSDSGGHVLPADYVANRIYVRAVTSSGDTLRLFTDTGGGRFLVLTRPVVEQLGLPITDTLSVGRRSFETTPVPPFREDGRTPSTRARRAIVAPEGGRARILKYEDGRLGQSWFADRVWTFDYGEERLRLHDSVPAEAVDPDHTVDLAFLTDSTGRRVSHHPRIEATIADRTYSFLFDTGATTVLTDSAQQVLGGPRRRGSGFIVASVFERWQKEHPDWRVVETASPAMGGTPLIRVPEVTIAGHTVGPVWFERRPDRMFRKGEVVSMDRSVAGALGGSLFQYFRITVDYPGARASFQRLD